jgi:hypothetical protein
MKTTMLSGLSKSTGPLVALPYRVIIQCSCHLQVKMGGFGLCTECMRHGRQMIKLGRAERNLCHISHHDTVVRIFVKHCNKFAHTHIHIYIYIYIQNRPRKISPGPFTVQNGKRDTFSWPTLYMYIHTYIYNQLTSGNCGGLLLHTLMFNVIVL